MATLAWLIRVAELAVLTNCCAVMTVQLEPNIHAAHKRQISWGVFFGTFLMNQDSFIQSS